MKGKAHNNILVTIANAMGVAVKTFGDATLCEGSDPGVVGLTGSTASRREQEDGKTGRNLVFLHKISRLPVFL